MKENEFLDGISNIESDLVERFVYMDNKLRNKENKIKAKSIWLRFGALAACLCLIISVIVIVPRLREDTPGGTVTTPNNAGNNTDITIPPDPPMPPINNVVPSISIVSSGNTALGKQELVLGEQLSGGLQGEVLPPRFEIKTVVEAEVIEVLPDTYYYIDSCDKKLNIAKLRIVDKIRGEGLPTEIFLSYSYYDAAIFEGYERFILSLDQIGAENYMLVNDTEGTFDYFSNMFEVCTADIGYGSVIAFNGGEVDESFWDKANYFFSVFSNKKHFDIILDAPNSNYYPATRNSTVDEVRSCIIELANNPKNGYIRKGYDYASAEDIFISDEAKEIKAYVAPSETNVFAYSLRVLNNRVIAEYTRIINGFKTDDVIEIESYCGISNTISKQGEAYTAEDLSEIPNIAEAIEKINFNEIKPPHIEVLDGMALSNITVKGIYRKANGRIYGVIRLVWYYICPECMVGSHITDDCYFLYDEDGNGSMQEREELRGIIGEDTFILMFPYDQMSRDYKFE